jgi:hypothetical protein
MALWVGFNAYCYGHYASEAFRQRADIGKKSSGLTQLGDERLTVAGTIQKDDNRITIDLRSPGKIKITIAERYTEDHIFSEFATQHAQSYEHLLGQQEFSGLVQNLKAALRRPDGHSYVVNMSKASQYELDGDVEGMAARGIIVMFDHTSSLGALKDVLYQIRCNVFHGEKVPGEVNDDRILQTATPILQALLHALVSSPPEP